MAKKKIKIGLALGGGAYRGFAHIGVLEELTKVGVPIDIISGSSIGSLVAAYYALNGTVEGLADKMLKISQTSLIKLLDFSVHHGLLNQKKVTKTIANIIDKQVFADAKIPLFIAATNLNNGQVKTLNKGSLVSAIWASCAMPVIFKPYKQLDAFLADGALSEPVPIEPLRQAGADIVIAVNLYHAQEFNKQSLSAASVLFRSSRIMMYQLAQEKCKAADIVINVNLSKAVIKAGMKYIFSKEDSLQAIEQGKKDARKVIKEIIKLTKKDVRKK